MIDVLSGNKGAALITALMLTMLSLVIAMALLNTVITRTGISASQKRYLSALSAAKGGVELVTKEIIPRLITLQLESKIQQDFGQINLHISNYACLQQKLNFSQTSWNTCSRSQSSSDPNDSPDISFVLSGSDKDPSFSVIAKIIDTHPGNSDKSGIDYLDQGSGVTGVDTVIHPEHVPALFDIAVQGVGSGLVREKARLSLLYAF